MVRLSDSELKVIKVIWDKGIVTSHEIIKALDKKEWKGSTIQTFIKRLLNKKAIIICQKKGKQYFYQANIDKTAYIKEITRDFILKCKMLLETT